MVSGNCCNTNSRVSQIRLVDLLAFPCSIWICAKRVQDVIWHIDSIQIVVFLHELLESVLSDRDKNLYLFHVE
jgi:hypothetical protein